MFKEIIRTLKSRKNEIISEVLEKFSVEKEKISGDEYSWTNKQEITEKLLCIMNDRDDKNLLTNSKFVLDGLRKLNENVSFKSIKVYNDIDNTMVIKSGDNIVEISHEELIHYLSNYLRICEPNTLEYKS